MKVKIRFFALINNRHIREMTFEKLGNCRVSRHMYYLLVIY